MNDFRYLRERLQGSRSELLGEQELGEVVELPVIGHCEHGAETLEVYVARGDFVLAGKGECTVGIGASDGE